MFFGDRHHPRRETKELLNRRGKKCKSGSLSIKYQARDQLEMLKFTDRWTRKAYRCLLDQHRTIRFYSESFEYQVNLIRLPFVKKREPTYGNAS